MCAAALDFHARHGGAAQRLWAWLSPQLDAVLPKAPTAAGSPGVSPSTGD
jgi:hypothetical protein